ncbi:MAG: GNAT family N-acetyltransferase [Lachnospiraceae bacterium]|nr:GNAT family N-acetyltransferase [Lachnospiraceae bacterium]MBP3595247.1 GNAT family N-acetyltransferase [Lachnospiraceae bacterium]
MENNNLDEIHELEWDTDFFGIDSYKCTISEIEQLEKIVDFVNDKDRLFFTVINQDNQNCINYKIPQLLGKYSFLADINMNLKKNIEKHNLNLRDDITIEITNNLEPNEQVVSLAQNFKYSRFFNDERLGEQRFKLYHNWIANAFRKEDKYYVLAKVDEKIVGFILFSHNGNESVTIELTVVNKNYQSKGIGNYMFTALDNYLNGKGVPIVYVGTQVSNIAAINFYFKQGFKINKINSIYHIVKKG